MDNLCLLKIDQKFADGIQEVEETQSCSRCQKGHLVIRENNLDNNKFSGCSNYPLCDLTFKQLEIINDHVKCTSCGSYMVKRSGRNGKFYGCINYPYCNNTIKFESIANKINNKTTNLEFQFSNDERTH
ncbi:MAG TPA: topoisomerase DNA-binding C4 zinc finger domain-containing protein [Clostridium sp.]|uniref:DNA topoisomerase family protein n=1 Tax=Clostridium sp. TaxID=1506 RepID=UPI002F92656D